MKIVSSFVGPELGVGEGGVGVGGVGVGGVGVGVGVRLVLKGFSPIE